MTVSSLDFDFLFGNTSENIRNHKLSHLLIIRDPMATQKAPYTDEMREEGRKANKDNWIDEYYEIACVAFELSNPIHHNDIHLWVRGLITRRGKALDIRVSRRGKWTRKGVRLYLDKALMLYAHLQTILPMLQAYEGPGVKKDGSIDLSGLITKTDGDKIDD